jgi:alkylation response protein AidB-like acyl-CoA dehydrogenase
VSTIAPTDLDAFRQEVRSWLAQATIPELPLDHAARFTAGLAWQRELHRAGWLGIHWPREFGGRGLTALHHLAFSEELARARAPHPIGLIGLDVVGPTIVRHGTNEQRRRLLPPMLSGEEIWCQGFSEPDAGSDLAALRASGRIDGDEITVSGQKVWTSWADEAQWCAALVRTDPGSERHHGISYLLIDMRLPGISVRPIIQPTGDAEFNEVFFDGVRVPRANVLGTLGGGWALAMDTLGHERAGYAVRRGVENQVALEDLIAELRDHLSSAKTTASDRVAASIGAAIVAVRGFAAQCEQILERLQDAHEPSPLDSVDKLQLAKVEQTVYGVATDLLGAYRAARAGRPLGLNAERWIRGQLYARAATVYGGSAEIQRSIIAERLLGLPRSR